MCQAAVFLRAEGDDTEIMRDVALVEMTEEGIRLETLFGEPKLVKARLKSIDLLKNVIILEPGEEA